MPRSHEAGVMVYDKGSKIVALTCICTWMVCMGMDTHVNACICEYFVNTQEIPHLMPRSHETGVMA